MNQELQDEIKKIAGANLRRIRENAGDSITDTSNKTQFSTVAISNYELGKRKLDIVYLVIFCKIYKVDYSDVLDTVVKNEMGKADYERLLK